MGQSLEMKSGTLLVLMCLTQAATCGNLHLCFDKSGKSRPYFTDNPTDDNTTMKIKVVFGDCPNELAKLDWRFVAQFVRQLKLAAKAQSRRTLGKIMAQQNF